jgi:hypothetical protein
VAFSLCWPSRARAASQRRSTVAAASAGPAYARLRLTCLARLAVAAGCLALAAPHITLSTLCLQLYKVQQFRCYRSGLRHLLQ